MQEASLKLKQIQNNSSSDEDSLDFQDLQCQFDHPPINCPSEPPITNHQIEKMSKTTKSDIPSPLITPTCLITQTNNKQIQDLESVIEHLKKNNEELQIKYETAVSTYKHLLSKLVQQQELMRAMQDQINQLTSEKQQISTQTKNYKRKLECLEQKHNLLQSSFVQQQFYEEKDKEVRNFLNKFYKIDICTGKPTVTLISNLLSDMEHKFNEIGQEINQLSFIIESEDQKPYEGYNHWVNLAKLQKIGEYLIKQKQTIYDVQNDNLRLKLERHI